MKIKNSGLPLALLPACLLFAQTAAAWQQEYIVSDPQNTATERYTWDSERPTAL